MIDVSFTEAKIDTSGQICLRKIPKIISVKIRLYNIKKPCRKAAGLWLFYLTIIMFWV